MARSSRRSPRWGVRALVAVFAVALIAFSGWSLFEYGQGSDPVSWLMGQPALQTTQEAQDNSNGSSGAEGASSDEAGSQQGDASDADGQTAQDGSQAGGSDSSASNVARGDDADPSQREGANAAATDASGAAGSSQASSGADASGATTGGAEDPAASQGADGSGRAAASDGQAAQTQEPKPAPQPTSETQQPQQSQPQTISVSVTIDGSPAGGSTHGGTAELSPGANVYDALVAVDGNVNARGSVYGTYVAAIDGLAEKQHGSASGWLYAVNGVRANTACSNYQLSDGDVVTWTYWVGDELPS